MKKKSIAALLGVVCLLFTACGGNAEETTAAETAVVTTVATTQAPIEPEPAGEWVTKTVYLQVGMHRTQWDGSGESYAEYAYDEYGNLIRSSSKSASGEEYGHSEYTYDEMGNRLTYYSYNAEGECTFHTEYTYDKQGNCLGSKNYRQDGTLSSEYVYSYDENGYLIEEHYTFDGEVTAYRYEYNESYTQMTEYRVGESGEYISSVETYGEEGNILTRDGYRADGSQSAMITYTYDDAGRLVREDHPSFFETQASYEVLYTYDENGNMTVKNVDYYYGYQDEYTYEAFDILVWVEN